MKRMKKLQFSVYLLCILVTYLSAQTMERTVIGSSGGSGEVNNIYIDWTVGEVVTETIYNDQLIVSEGFHQPTGFVRMMYRITGNVLGSGQPYANVEVFLYLASETGSSVPVFNYYSTDGAFQFAFIPDDQYIVYAVPDYSDEFLPTYYPQTIYQSSAYKLDADANIGGLDLNLVSRYDFIENKDIEKLQELSVYPNPFKDELNIIVNTPASGIFNLKVCDLTGAIVIVNTVTANELNSLILDNLPQGVYVISVENNNYFYNKLVSKIQ